MTTSTTTDATTTTGELIGADRLNTPAKAKEAAAKRTTRTHKPAAPKGADKPVGKGEKKAPAKPAAKASGKGARFFISCGRPVSGSGLHAHTEAFFQIYGMHKEQGAPKATAQRVLGATAVNYHKGNARFEERDGKIFLTKAGLNHFAARVAAIDSAMVKAFVSVLTTGKADGVAVKVQDNIAAIAA